MQIYTVLWDSSINPIGHQGRVMQTSPSGHLKTPGTRHVEKLPLGTHCTLEPQRAREPTDGALQGPESLPAGP